MYGHDFYAFRASVVDCFLAKHFVPLCDEIFCVGVVSFKEMCHVVVEGEEIGVLSFNLVE